MLAVFGLFIVVEFNQLNLKKEKESIQGHLSVKEPAGSVHPFCQVAVGVGWFLFLLYKHSIVP